jgi:outer membrane protein assembly factor BamB
MNIMDKLIGNLMAGCLFACCIVSNIQAQIPSPRGTNGGSGGTNTGTYPPYILPPVVITYKTNTTLKWALTMPGYPSNGQLSMSPDGNLYVPVTSHPWDNQQSLWSINLPLINTNDSAYPAPDSFTNWVFGFGNGAQYTPTVGRDGTIYTHLDIYDGQQEHLTLNALSPTNGAVIWTFSPVNAEDGPGETAIGNNGTVYTVSGNYICALTNAPGITNSLTFQVYYNPLFPDAFISPIFNFTNVGLKWMYYNTNCSNLFDSGLNSCLPVIGHDGMIYCNCYSKILYAISETNGVILWSMTNVSNVAYHESSPAIGSDGTIYYGCGTNFFAVDPKAAMGTNGMMLPKWVYNTVATNSYGSVSEGFAYSPVIASDGTVYVESVNSAGTNRLFAFNPATGIPIWSIPVGTGMGNHGYIYKSGSLAVAADGEIYVADGDGSLTSVAPNGNINWSYQTGDLALGSPLIGSDGTIYVYGQNGDEENGVVYAIAGVSPIACSPWPMDGRNARRTGVVAFAAVNSPTMTTNGFQFAIAGPTNVPVCPCASYDLVTWTNLGQTVLTGGKTNFVDIGSTNYPYRFYKAYPQ